MCNYFDNFILVQEALGEGLLLIWNMKLAEIDK